MDDYDEKSKLAIRAAAYYVMARTQIFMHLKVSKYAI